MLFENTEQRANEGGTSGSGYECKGRRVGTCNELLLKRCDSSGICRMIMRWSRARAESAAKVLGKRRVVESARQGSTLSRRRDARRRRGRARR